MMSSYSEIFFRMFSFGDNLSSSRKERSDFVLEQDDDSKQKHDKSKHQEQAESN